jgi:nicotinamidase-related amidase
LNTTSSLPTIDPGHAALLVMDYQAGIIGRLDEPDALVERAAEAIALARRHGVQVGYVRVAFTEDDLGSFPPTSRMGARAAEAGDALRDDSPHTAIDERLAPEEGDIVVRKVRVGAFSTTDLAEQLNERGIDTLILAGISTSGVVLSTVRDAHDRDYRVVVLSDACADTDPAVHSLLMERVFPRQADVITVEELRGLLP